MSEARIPLADVVPVARELRDLLAPATVRIAVAGSIRRRQSYVKDIELVVVPRIEEVDAGGFWGGTQDVDRFAALLTQLREAGTLVPRQVEIHRRDGSVDQQERVGEKLQMLEYRGIPVDLFVVRPPAEWGVIFAIRTGPWDFGKRIVTECKRFFVEVRDGQVLHHGRPVPCPEERDFFAAVGQAWLDPWERHANRVRLTWPVLRAS